MLGLLQEVSYLGAHTGYNKRKENITNIENINSNERS